MACVAHRLKIAVILVACFSLVECTGSLDSGATGPDSGRVPSALGAAKERLTASDWKVIGTGDFNWVRLFCDDPISTRKRLDLLVHARDAKHFLPQSTAA